MSAHPTRDGIPRTFWDRHAFRIIMLLLFIISAGLAAARKDIRTGFDEVAHVSYVAHIQKFDQSWPRLEDLRLLSADSLHFSSIPSYLNHPSVYYWLLARLSPHIEGNPQSLNYLRMINIAFASVGFACLLWLIPTLSPSKDEEYAFLIPIFSIPVLAQIAGSVNNDNLAFMGGALALFSAHRLLVTRSTKWLALLLAGLIAASAAKLTGFLLIGGLSVFVILFLIYRNQHQQFWIWAVLAALIIAASPYLILDAQYGSPAPETPGQIALLKSTTPEGVGWEHAPRLSFIAFFMTFIFTFFIQWMPTLLDPTPLQNAMAIIPAVTVIASIIGLWISARHIFHKDEKSLDVLVVAGFAALGFTFACHLLSSFRHHVSFAYIADAYPRYYLPLIAIVPLANLSLLYAIQRTSVRATLTYFFIVTPIIYRLLGAWAFFA